MSRGKIYHNITELIGNTPLLELHNIDTGKARVLVKIETFNPLSNIKDRAGLAMIEDAEKRGILKEGSVIIEPTSGNTGIALSYIGKIKGYKVIIVMPETMSEERKKLMKALGAELVLTSGKLGMKGSIDKAYELAKQYPSSFIPLQFENPANAEYHYKTTGPEIWNDTEGAVDYVVAGVGTGGTICGISKYLKEKKPSYKGIAVEPFESAIISGEKPGPHLIQGIGANFIPKLYDPSVIDEVIKVKGVEAGEAARLLVAKEGVFAGISSGANLAAALQIAKRPESEGKTIVAILPDTGDRYLSTWLYNGEN
ncbi:cysteine synthase A [Anaeromyces robustus]|jgi:cysteine synthase A|uniref:L-3-cyanoalanine synthase n=1 Tax=Anaeromyces robustus TaxID=1754192 RepID=A0A1Y1WUM5_9FUNG|nr:cysteine synthase A [Anaeromyces robustus]|eukprot:ORX77105.1 cysteine synthase A [Anaeromyces robustus]